MMSVIRYENIPVSMLKESTNILEYNPILWLDASDNSTLFDNVTAGNIVTSNNQPIARWEDKSGRGRHLIQSQVGSRPIKKINAQNGLDVINFNGLGQNLKRDRDGTPFLINPYADYTFFVVSKLSLNAQNQGMIFSNSAPGIYTKDIVYGHGIPNSTSRFAQINNGADGSATFTSPVQDAYIIETVAFRGYLIYDRNLGFIPDPSKTNADRLKVFQNASQKTLSFAGYTVPSSVPLLTEAGAAFMVGGYNAFTSDWWFKGDIAEIIIFESALNSTQQSLVEKYLAGKWGITLEATVPTYFIAPATDIRISNAAKLGRYNTLTTDSTPDMRLGGALDTKISFSYPICNKFLNNDSSSDSFNFASGIFVNNLTGTDSTDLIIGNTSFKNCFLDSMSVNIVPFQPAIMTVDFTCTNPPTGLPMSSGLAKNQTNMTNKFAYGHFATISGADNYSSDIHANISFSYNFKRTYSYAISKRNAHNVFLDEVSKQLQIKATNIKTFINESGALSSFSVDLKNELGESVLPSGTLSTSTNGRLSAQNLTSSPPNILTADITIDEPLL